MRCRPIDCLTGVALLAVSLMTGTSPAKQAAQDTPPTERQRAVARFLSRATFGADLELIEEVAEVGEAAWLEEQFDQEPTLHTPLTVDLLERTEEAYDEILETLEVGDEQAEEKLEEHLEEVFGDLYGPSRRFAWWQTAITAPDQLRQRVAFALSQIFVVSDRVDELADAPVGLASYYDVLVRGAFGNYRDLLLEVTLHPVMGLYLSHLNNQRSDPQTGRFPDENYAREVMQLFSIGLYELAPDGSRRLDATGRPIPTYGNPQIVEFAKVFTGLGPGGPEGEFGSDEVDFTRPMRMYQAFHDRGEKRLLGDVVVRAGWRGMRDVESAIDNLFQHPNVGPFIGRRLIQRLVTSNPSPAYLKRVSAAFADNGGGVRGDLQAVVRAILLDPEAASPADSPPFGRVREPLLRHVAFLRAFQARSESGSFLELGYRFEEDLLQHPLSASSVFNFFSPDHQPRGLEWVAPELQITTTSTIVNMANLIEDATRHDEWTELPELGLICLEDPEACVDLVACPDERCFESVADELIEELGEDAYEHYAVELDFENEFELAEDDLPALLDRIELLLTRGTMSPHTRGVLQAAVTPLDDPEERLQLALYLTLISPDYAVAR